jgi:hypothetical protein
MLQVQIFGNDINKSKMHAGRHEEQIYSGHACYNSACNLSSSCKQYKNKQAIKIHKITFFPVIPRISVRHLISHIKKIIQNGCSRIE